MDQLPVGNQVVGDQKSNDDAVTETITTEHNHRHSCQECTDYKNSQTIMSGIQFFGSLLTFTIAWNYMAPQFGILSGYDHFDYLEVAAMALCLRIPFKLITM